MRGGRSRQVQWLWSAGPEWEREYFGSVVEQSSLGLGHVVRLVARVKHESADVAGETGLIGLEAFLTSVLASVVDGDADGAGKGEAESD